MTKKKVRLVSPSKLSPLPSCLRFDTFFSTLPTACRTESRGQAAIDKIEAETGIKGKVTVLPLDLSSQASVKAFTIQFKRLHSRLDVLVNSEYLESRMNKIKKKNGRSQLF